MARRTRLRNAALLLLAAAIVLLPLLFSPHFEAGSFAGTDGKARALIETIEPGYRPWAAPLWASPGQETESLLFALQAAAGAGVLGYCLGLRHGRRRAGRAGAAGGAPSDDAGNERH